jgi:uncharacterized phage protein gp47/JayE
MAFGYDTTTGWNPVTYALLLDDLKNKYKAQTSDNVDVENGPAADMLRTVSLMFKDAWDDQLGGYNSGFVSAAPGSNGVAEGSALENLLSSRIGPKLAAVASTITLELGGTPGTIIPAGQTVVLEDESTTWSLDAEVTIGGGGTIDGEFTYSETGPKLAVAASDWTITTPVSGWDTADNAADAIPGRDEETDAEYRTRYIESLNNDVISEVRQVEGVTSASLIEHQLGTPDSYWGMTHWIEVLVVGGDDEAIATAIEATRSNGSNTMGTESVVLADAKYASGTVTIKFSRPTLVQCYATVTITKGEGYPSDASAAAIAARVTAIKDAIVDFFANLDPGEDTSCFQVAVAVGNNSGIPGLANVVVLVDDIDPPVNTGVLSAELRDQLTIDDLDIDVTGA